MSININQYLSTHTGLAARQLAQADRCDSCKGARARLVVLGEAVQQSFYPDERIQKVAALVASPAIGHINRHHPYVSDFLAVQSRLTHRQLTDAKQCEECIGCFKRLVSREQEVFQNPLHEQAERIEVLRNSKAIGLIDQHHPFNMGLIAKHTRLDNRHIQSIENCPNAECNCKQIWAELKDLLETIEYGAPKKDVVHEIFILENRIQDPEELHESIQNPLQE